MQGKQGAEKKRFTQQTSIMESVMAVIVRIEATVANNSVHLLLSRKQ